MVDPKPEPKDDGTTPKKSSSGGASATVPDPLSAPAKSLSVPSCGVVLDPPRAAGFGFTLSEIFDQHPPGARTDALGGAAMPTAARPEAEDPGVAQAMERGEKLFPDVMKASGHAIHSALVSVMPVTFAALANFGTDHLATVAKLVGQVSAMTDDLHKIDATEQIRAIVAQAERMHAKPSLLDRLGVHDQFDLATANATIDAIRQRLTAELYKMRKASVDFERAMIPLDTALCVTRILADMTEQADMSAVIRRKSDLFTSSATEVDIAKKQLDNLQKLAQEGILQCDELKGVTLPAMGFRQSL